MAYNALVGNGDEHPRNHGLLNDGTGWRTISMSQSYLAS
jgi:serine/threonine-protein kinase HipA